MVLLYLVLYILVDVVGSCFVVIVIVACCFVVIVIVGHCIVVIVIVGCFLFLLLLLFDCCSGKHQLVTVLNAVFY